MRRALPLILFVALASGCGFIYRQPVFQGTLLEKTSVEQLKEGMTQSQVIALLGTPPLMDPFHQHRWDYTASQRRGHQKTEVKMIILWFEGDVLSKWEGEYFPEQDVELTAEMRKFGNLSKDKNKNRSH